MSDFPSSKFERGKIFAKTGFDVGKNYAKHYLKKSVSRKKDKADDLHDLHNENAKKIFSEFTKLRGTALKIAQSLSMDQGLLPEEFSEVLTQAQYQVPPINKALARSIVKKELGDYPEKLFDEFSADAIAAASIGQVHKAKLKNGQVVAVKIQYPNVRDTIKNDLKLAKLLFKRFIKGPDVDEYFEEIQERLLEETDYIHEGNEIKRFAKRFNTEKFATPRWIEDYSSRKVLTMTFIEGQHLNKFLKTNPSQEERNYWGQLLWDFFHKQIKYRGPIHADAHPGNFLFKPDGRLGIIDFGCVKSFPQKFYHKYLKLLPTHLDEDIEEVKRLYLDLGIIRENPSNPKKEEQFFQFCNNYANAFALPYKKDTFDFGDEQFKKDINTYARQMPLMNETRGSKHFIYSTRVHLGLYNLLMKLKAVIDTRESRKIAENAIYYYEGNQPVNE